MNSSQIKGLPVMSIAEGVTLGKVDDVYADADTRNVLGFFVEDAGGSAPGAAYLDPADIRSIGADAVMVDSRAAMRGDAVRARIGSLVSIDALLKRNVMTEGGVSVGAVANVVFEPPSYAFTQIEVSPGLFKTNTMIPIAEVVSIGPELIIVSNAVGAEPAEPSAESGEPGAAGEPIAL